MSISRRAFLAGLAAGAGASIAVDADAASYERFMGNPDRVGLLHDTTLCVGCRSCEFACNEVNDLSPVEPPIGDTEVFEELRRPSPDAFTIVNRYETEIGPVFRKHQCMHCNEPCCASVCLVKALTKTPEGPIHYNADLCIGCRYCLTACPYYSLGFEYDEPLTPRVTRCTMCRPRILEGQNPGCADACPMGAIVFGKRADLIELARDRIRSHPERYNDHIYGENEFGGASWMTLTGASFAEIGLFDDVTHAPLPERTKGFLSIVPLVLSIWPGLLLGFYAFTKRKDQLAKKELEAAVAEAVSTADEETKQKLAAAAARATKAKEKAMAMAVKKALKEQAEKDAADKEGTK